MSLQVRSRKLPAALLFRGRLGPAVPSALEAVPDGSTERRVAELEQTRQQQKQQALQLYQQQEEEQRAGTGPMSEQQEGGGVGGAGSMRVRQDVLHGEDGALEGAVHVHAWADQGWSSGVFVVPCNKQLRYERQSFYCCKLRVVTFAEDSLALAGWCSCDDCEDSAVLEQLYEHPLNYLHLRNSAELGISSTLCAHTQQLVDSLGGSDAPETAMLGAEEAADAPSAVRFLYDRKQYIAMRLGSKLSGRAVLHPHGKGHLCQNRSCSGQKAVCAHSQAWKQSQSGTGAAPREPWMATDEWEEVMITRFDRTTGRRKLTCISRKTSPKTPINELAELIKGVFKLSL